MVIYNLFKEVKFSSFPWNRKLYEYFHYQKDSLLSFKIHNPQALKVSHINLRYIIMEQIKNKLIETTE